jgi:hypothetical protein
MLPNTPELSDYLNKPNSVSLSISVVDFYPSWIPDPGYNNSANEEGGK